MCHWENLFPTIRPVAPLKEKPLKVVGGIYFPQFGQEARPVIEILNAAVRIASSGLKRSSVFVSRFMACRVLTHVDEENWNNPPYIPFVAFGRRFDSHTATFHNLLRSML